MRQTTTMRSRATGWLSVAAITLVGAALRIGTLNTRSFWLDETTAIRQAVWSIPYMLEQMANNVHPPLFHTLLHYWIVVFGRSEIAVRWFPLSWGIVAIPLVFWLGRTIYDRRVGFIAAAVLAISPFFVWYAQEARMYTMMLVLAILSTGALWEALRSNRARWWLLFCLSTAAGLMTQYFFAFLLAGQCAYVAFSLVPARVRAAREAGTGRRGRTPVSRLLSDVPEIVPLAIALVAATIPLMWWLPQVFRHAELFRGVSQPFNYGWEAPRLGVHFNELILVPVEWLFGFHSELAMRNLVSLWPLLITLVFVSAGLARRPSPRTTYLLFAGVGGAGLIAALGQWQPILEARYFTATTVPLVILSARAFAGLRPRAFRALAATLLAIAAVSWTDQSFNPDSIVKWDNRAAMGIVADGFRPGDTILLLPNFVTSIPEYYLPADAYAAVEKVPSYDAMGRPRNSPAKLAEDLSRQVGPSRRVWVIATWQETPRIALDRTMVGDWLAGQGYTVRGDHPLRRIRVTLYETDAPPGFFLTPGATGATGGGR